MGLTRRVTAPVIAIGCLVAVALAWPGSAHAIEVFKVSGVEVDVKAGNASRARTRALAGGQRAALNRLFRRIVPAVDQGRLPDLSDADISEIVRGFEVANERVAPNRYIATLTFRFNGDAIGRLLRAHGIPYAITPSEPVAVLPLYRTERELLLWEDTNPWRAAWAMLEEPDGLVPVLVPIGELSDLVLVDSLQAADGDRASLVELAGRYRATVALVTEAVVSRDAVRGVPIVEVLMRAYSSEGTRAASAVYEGDGKESLGELLARAALGTRVQIEDGWKEANLLRFDLAGRIAMDVPLTGLGDWLDIRRRLSRPAFVQKVDVDLLSANFARVEVHYVGEIDQLTIGLYAVGLVLSREADLWILRRRGAAPSGSGAPTSE
jgi:hypothetical protein